MIELLIVAACYLTFYAKVGGTAVQVAALVLLFGAAAYAVVLDRVKAIPLSSTEMVLYCAGVISVVLGLLGGDEVVGSSVAFLIVIVLISIVGRSVSLERLLDSGAAVALLCVITCVVVERATVLQALSITVGRNGLLRLMPLENHPDMTGYIFAAGSILLVRRALVSKSTLERMMMAAATLLSWTFILAASARSSIIALFAAGLMAIVFEFRRSRLVSFKWISISAVCIAIIGVLFFAKIAKYLRGILELDSGVRGVGSGGSGRLELWWRGIATLFNDPVTLAVGGGFRSSAAELIGFSTESSYITILLDSGLFFGSAIILLFWYAPIKALRLTVPQARHSSKLVLLPCLLTFIVVEAVFNRYLLAIGNPASLVTLIILLALSMQPKSSTANVEVPKGLATRRSGLHDASRHQTR